MRSTVEFWYLTGIADHFLRDAVLVGGWDENGHLTTGAWSRLAMREAVGSDGCPAFTVRVELESDGEQTFPWGVEVTRPSGETLWGIMTEDASTDQVRCIRYLQLNGHSNPGAQNGAAAAIRREAYFLNQSRRLGAQKLFPPHNGSTAASAPAQAPLMQFSIWAPNARNVRVRVAQLWDENGQPLVDSKTVPTIRSLERTRIHGGHMRDPDAAGRCFGSDNLWPPLPMTRADDGVWTTSPEIGSFSKFDHVPYMYEVTTDAGSTVLRTDLYSRCQIGSGSERPASDFSGSPRQLDGTVGCSVVVDPDRVTRDFAESDWPERYWLDRGEFFASPPPAPSLAGIRLSDLVIYELHVGALGFGARRPDEPGTLEDAIALLDYLEDLGVNAIELLPLSEFGGGGAGWGYATSHYFAIEYSGGGRDQYKWFIRECHRRGIAVILDVVYNHYHHDAARAQWMLDSERHDKNVYYWYEGTPDQHAHFNAAVPVDQRGFGGYVDNMSSGFAPRYWEEMVRNLFVSSALALVEEFQVDGLRVDQTTSIRSYNVLHADGRRLDHVNAYGAKLLRELTRSLRFVKPNVLLMAEDHELWDGVTSAPERGGLGFDAVWFADFYHHLIGDTDKSDDYAKLIKNAGFGDDRHLAMDYFGGALQATQGGKKVVYYESHDEAGNGKWTARTIRVAVNGAPLVGETRRAAEARCRFAAGVTLLSAGVPLFLFGEEVGAQQPFLYGHVLENREDLPGLRSHEGARLFEFQRQLISLRRRRPGLRSPDIDVLYTHNDQRIIAFRRWGSGEEFLIVASLNNQPMDRPNYVLRSERIPAGRWQEIFNSDAADYGGAGVGNYGAVLNSAGGAFACVVPANGFVVFSRSN